jgi:hypothetical protein
MTTETNSRRGFLVSGGFNTGRLYSREGPRIFWAARGDGWVYFKDCDRLISGWMHRETPGNHAAPVLPAWLLGRYDRGEYLLSPASEAFDDIPARIPDCFDFGAALRL